MEKDLEMLRAKSEDLEVREAGCTRTIVLLNEEKNEFADMNQHLVCLTCFYI